VTLQFADRLDRETVIRATDCLADLVMRPEVASAWTRESTCAGMTVGGLARHLIGQPVNVVALLSADRPDDKAAPTIPVLEHYARAAWVREDLSGDTNQAIRATADAQAGDGFDAALQVLSGARERLMPVLESAPTTMYIPWQGWRLATDDFLVTRLMEIVVHSDDLAASIGVPGPDFGFEVLDPVLRLLASLAVRRHGQDSVVRALARPQRAPSDASAF
jgi:hypothetical protein